MTRKNILSILTIILVLTACSSSKNITGVWVDKEKLKDKTFHSVFIVVITADVQVRAYLEAALAAKVTERGFKAVKSNDVMPTLLSDPKAPGKEEIVQKVNESNCDAVIATALLNKDEAIRYRPGSTSYAPTTYWAFSGTYSGYYTNYVQNVSTSDYYANDKTYFMLTNLYDAQSKELMWSVQSEVFNPSSLQRFSSGYISGLMKQLEKAKILKK